ncbi:GGDEF domain-containing protein [Sphingoaurantiacus capsulatus]|uniref:diguanylate cyclase n=1 Tax=Sphingoaurantiacus capsulatus TaxID=1771310 RepID=A0ABV7XHM2_9SPHN
MRWLDALFPPPPAELRDALVRFQYHAVRRQIPSLHLTALVNVCIVMAVLWHTGSPVYHYAWMPLVGAFNLHRIWLWRSQTDAVPPHAERFLRHSTYAAIGSVTAISVYSATTYALDWFPYPILIPISFAFGSFSIAHGLASMRPAASSVIAIGIFPSATVMILSGDFLSLCLGVSAASVALLQLRFLTEHQSHIWATLALQQEVEQLANRDGLTGLMSRRAFLAAWEAEMVAETRPPRALLVLDIDHFKAINDRHGHDVGDRVLFQFAALLAGALRGTDLAGRFGGEEFLLLVDADRPADAEALAVRLARLIDGHDFRSPGCPVEHVTVSIGVHCVDVAEPSFDAAFSQADAALYAAKSAGRNCVRLCEATAARSSASA